MANPSLASFRRTVTQAWPAQQERAGKALLLRMAHDGHLKIMAEQRARSGGVAPDFDAYANTPSNKNLSSVVLPGPIVYRYRYHREIILTALDMLEKASPEDSGLYKKSHMVFVNGNIVPRSAIPQIKASDEVMIVNVVDYARRLEIGKTKSGRAFLVSVPNQIYDRVGKRLKAKYKQLAQVRTQFVNISVAYALKHDQPSRSFTTGRMVIGSKTRRDRGKGAKITYPAIVIKGLS